MDCAARWGHLEVVKWIHANRTERCTNMAIKNVVTEGHVGIAYWLITHISDLSPEELTLQDVNIVRFVRNNFEMLLFLHEHFPHVLKHNSEKILRASPRTDAKADPRQHVTNWLEEEYSIYLEDFTDEDNSEESM
ncbi:hypothetical protein PHMEG_00038091 [Phytophthora megakarya]|uniref:Uncharacterized protein n=1 Tax=Phytophthora megakarya TaxID=4795 RepID=A0A225UJN8_9STRA|nr:hypothetical protein PHMEG_00038091 [Phytophthora megakarya]